MGEFTTFECRECGYRAEQIRWGVSMRDPRIRFMPAFCVECKTICEVDLTGADIMVDEFNCLTGPRRRRMSPNLRRRRSLGPDHYRAAGRHQLAHLQDVRIVHAHAPVAYRHADEFVTVGAVDGHLPPARPP
jgi:hypothetical protein